MGFDCGPKNTRSFDTHDAAALAVCMSGTECVTCSRPDGTEGRCNEHLV